MSGDQAQSDQAKAFQERVKTMSREELLALAEIIKRELTELREQLQAVLDVLEQPRGDPPEGRD